MQIGSECLGVVQTSVWPMLHRCYGGWLTQWQPLVRAALTRILPKMLMGSPTSKINLFIIHMREKHYKQNICIMRSQT